MGAFSTRPYENTSHLSHAFKQHESSARHKRLEKKLTDNSVSVYEEMVLGVEKINLPQKKYKPTIHAKMYPFNKLHDKKTPDINGQLWRPNQLHSTKIRGTYHEKLSRNLSKERYLSKQHS